MSETAKVPVYVHSTFSSYCVPREVRKDQDLVGYAAEGRNHSRVSVARVTGPNTNTLYDILPACYPELDPKTRRRKTGGWYSQILPPVKSHIVISGEWRNRLNPGDIVYIDLAALCSSGSYTTTRNPLIPAGKDWSIVSANGIRGKTTEVRAWQRTQGRPGEVRCLANLGVPYMYRAYSPHSMSSLGMHVMRIEVYASELFTWWEEYRFNGKVGRIII